jgi:hypothetical protein
MTLANAPLSAWDARLNASDLPDGASEIFLQGGMDSPMTDLPVRLIKAGHHEEVSDEPTPAIPGSRSRTRAGE